MAAVKRTRKDWEEITSRQQASGLSQVAWCKAHEVNINTFQAMKRKVSKAASSSDEPVTPGATLAREDGSWVKLPALVAAQPDQGSAACPIPAIVVHLGSWKITMEVAQ